MAGQANKGKSLEVLIESANNYYDKAGQALIQKIATPTKVIRSGAQIVSAFHERKSTVDFSGIIANGYPVAFDAKQTMNKTLLRLGMIEPHQLEYMIKFHGLGGIAFVIVEFTESQEIFRIEIDYIRQRIEEGAKSIPLSDIRKHCQSCSAAGTNPLHYLHNILWRETK